MVKFTLDGATGAFVRENTPATTPPTLSQQTVVKKLPAGFKASRVQPARRAKNKVLGSRILKVAYRDPRRNRRLQRTAQRTAQSAAKRAAKRAANVAVVAVVTEVPSENAGPPRLNITYRAIESGRPNSPKLKITYHNEKRDLKLQNTAKLALAKMKETTGEAQREAVLGEFVQDLRVINKEDWEERARREMQMLVEDIPREDAEAVLIPRPDLA